MLGLEVCPYNRDLTILKVVYFGLGGKLWVAFVLELGTIGDMAIVKGFLRSLNKSACSFT